MRRGRRGRARGGARGSGRAVDRAWRSLAATSSGGWRSSGAWTTVPDFVSINLSEPGADELAAVVLDTLGIGVEAGVWTVAGRPRAG